MNQQPVADKDLQRKTVLVVEDEVEVRFVLTELLREAGHTVHEAVNAHEALRLLRTAVRFDAVVTDVQMPGEIDGIMLAEWIEITHPAIQVIVVSAHDVSRQFSQTSHVKFLMKPYAASHLLDCLRSPSPP